MLRFARERSAPGFSQKITAAQQKWRASLRQPRIAPLRVILLIGETQSPPVDSPSAQIRGRSGREPLPVLVTVPDRTPIHRSLHHRRSDPAASGGDLLAQALPQALQVRTALAYLTQLAARRDL